MARIHGRKGRLYVDLTGAGSAAPVAYLSQWSMDFTSDRVDVTAFGDSNKTYVQGLADASGTYSGFYDTESAQLYTAATDGAARKFYLYPTTDDNAEYFWGTAFFDFSISSGVDKAVEISGSYQAASTITKVT